MIFLDETQAAFLSGLSDAGSAEDFIGLFESLEEKWSSLHSNEKAFHSWFGSKKTEGFIRSVMSPVRHTLRPICALMLLLRH